MWLAAMTIPLALTLALLEICLRMLPVPYEPLQVLEHLRGFYQLDGQGRIETTPNWQGTIELDGRAVHAHTNELGLRGPELPPVPDGARRVLVIGDSFVWGMGVADDETIPAALERQLREEHGLDVQCGNAGMYGTGPREWSYTLERFRASFRPDAVVAVTYAGNDIGDTLSSPLTTIDGWTLDSANADKARASWRFAMALRSRLWMYLELFVILPLGYPIGGGAPPPAMLPPGLSAYEGYFFDVRPAQESSAPWLSPVGERMRAQFERFAIAAADLPTAIVVVPGREASSRERWRRGLGEILSRAARPELAEAFERGACSRRLAAIAKASGLPVVDLTDQFLALEDTDPLYLPTDYHYSPAGCRTVAEWIAPTVAALLQR